MFNIFKKKSLKKKETEEVEIDWSRPFYVESEKKPKLYYMVYTSRTPKEIQDFFQEIKLPVLNEKSLELSIIYGKDLDSVMWPLTSDNTIEAIGDKNLEIIEAAKRAKSCMIISGEILEDQNLRYLRDITNLIAMLFNYGAIAVYDLYTISIADEAIWRSRFVELDNLKFSDHVRGICSSIDENKVWLHTRGLIKFGRPDLSISNVCKNEVDVMAGLLHQYIDRYIDGEIIETGHIHKIVGRKGYIKCINQGSMDDPDFNNVHLELKTVGGSR